MCAGASFRAPPGRETVVRIRLSLLVLLLAGLYACGGPQEKAMKPAPETEIVLLYHSDDKGEYLECG
jgi:hypothetical protein